MIGPRPVPKSKNGGFDFTVTGTNRFKQNTLSKDSKAKMEELASKNDKKAKYDLYVNSLKQEIDKLDHELNYLKDKDMEHTQGITQMDKFFSDGVPINNNILALKSQYQTFNEAGQREMAMLEDKKMEELKRIEDIRADNEQIRYRVDEVRRDLNEYQAVSNHRAEEMKGLIAETKKYKEIQEEQIEQIYNEFKSLNDENMTIQRNVQRLKALGPQMEEQEKQKLKALQALSVQKDEQVTALEDKVQDLVDRMGVDITKSRMEQENLNLEERLSRLEKQINMAKVRIRETELILEGKAKERNNEAMVRRDLTVEIDNLRFKLDEAERFGDAQIDQQIKQRHNAIIRDFQRKIEATAKETGYYSDRRQLEEDDIQKMTGQKVELKEKNEEAEVEIEKLRRELKDKKMKIMALVKSKETYRAKSERLAKQDGELEFEISELKEKIPKTEAEIQEFRSKINVMEKQMEFAKQIKALNMEHLKISTTSNLEVNNNLNDFIRKFEDIQQTISPAKK